MRSRFAACSGQTTPESIDGEHREVLIWRIPPWGGVVSSSSRQGDTNTRVTPLTAEPSRSDFDASLRGAPRVTLGSTLTLAATLMHAPLRQVRLRHRSWSVWQVTVGAGHYHRRCDVSLNTHPLAAREWASAAARARDASVMIPLMRCQRAEGSAFSSTGLVIDTTASRVLLSVYMAS